MKQECPSDFVSDGGLNHALLDRGTPPLGGEGMTSVAPEAQAAFDAGANRWQFRRIDHD
jgi:hypothetical protein